MKGSVHNKGDKWYVAWYHQGKQYKIYRYKGEFIYNKKVADKLRSLMQSDFEADTFRIEKYIGEQWTDVIPYLNNWIESIKDTLSPATYKDYTSSIKNHLTPFFKAHQFQLHEIQYDVLMKLLKSIKRCGKGKSNVMYCLHSCLDYAWRSRRIQSVPPFPEKRHYQMITPEIQWLPEIRQMKVIDAIPEIHRPIFLWLKYHLRRPGEAMALQKIDYDPDTQSFIVRRSISNRIPVDRTKTGAVHLSPCHNEFLPYVIQCLKSFSQYFFTCPTSRKEGKRYSQTIMAKLWHDACKETGEDIKMYSGLKHSSCSQYVNEKGLSISELQSITDHARVDSVKRYARVELARKRELMERRGKVIPLKKVGNE